MKPDWDKLADKFNYKTNAVIADVDCTDDNAKPLCETYGVEGFPTLKTFGPGLPDDGQTYEGGREYKDLEKFTKKNSKKPCDAATLSNCGKRDKEYLEAIKDFDLAGFKAERENIEKPIAELTAEHKKEKDLFEKQKEEAMATMKKAEDVKKKLDKLQSKNSYKLFILKQKIPEQPKIEDPKMEEPQAEESGKPKKEEL